LEIKPNWGAGALRAASHYLGFDLS
jgi:hypothetical protein